MTLLIHAQFQCIFHVQVEGSPPTAITPISYQEYQSLPLQHSRQLSLDQLNGTLAYIAELTVPNSNTGAGTISWTFSCIVSFIYSVLVANFHFFFDQVTCSGARISHHSSWHHSKGLRSLIFCCTWSGYGSMSLQGKAFTSWIAVFLLLPFMVKSQKWHTDVLRSWMYIKIPSCWLSERQVINSSKSPHCYLQQEDTTGGHISRLGAPLFCVARTL